MTSEPQIGIFWVFKGKLLKFTAPLEQGSQTAEGIDSPFDHIDSWPDLQHQRPELGELEYEKVPRGRVLFLKESKKFWVYMDKTLHKPDIKKLILKEFHLPKTRTEFDTDPHYTTNPEELERLFRD